MLSKRDQIEKRIHGRDALEAVGIPLEFAAQIMLLASRQDVAIAIRAGKAFQLYQDLCIAKPSFIKAKTGNWGFTKGVIAENPSLGKIDAERNPVQQPTPPNNVFYIQHKIALSEVIAGLMQNPPEYELVSLDDSLTPTEYIAHYETLVVKVVSDNAPQQNNFLFKLHLHQSVAPPPIASHAIRTALFDIAFDEPHWWRQDWGEFSEKVHHRFPIEYQSKIDTPFQPLTIYGLLDNEQGLLPVTGDMDLLWITHPVHSDLPPSAHTVLNTTQLEDSARMLEALIELHTYFADKKNEIFDINEICDESVGREGCLTPFESFFTSKINERFAKVAPHITRLFQHGAENRNPGKPSDIDGRILHIWRGEVFLTENERELVDFVLQTDGFLEKNIIDVHPKWKMELWAPVINKQIALCQAVKPDVLLVYKRFVAPLFYPLQWATQFFSPKSQIAKADDWIDVSRTQPIGSFFETERFTSRQSQQQVEKLCEQNAGWNLDHFEKKLTIEQSSEKFDLQFQADSFSTNSTSPRAMAVMLKVAMILEVDVNHSAIHSPSAAIEKKFRVVWDKVLSPTSEGALHSAINSVDGLLTEVDAILQQIKDRPAFLQEGLSSFQLGRPRKLSFSADIKAQRAWLGFFNQKSADMSSQEKQKFMKAHSRIREVVADFNEMSQIVSAP